MKLCRLTVLVILFAMFSGANSFALEAFEINSFDIKMNVREDNSYEITEKISVSFSESRHGIIRSIPLKTYRGNWASVKNIKVNAHKYSTSRENGELNIKIGDANKYASQNEEYEISYVFDIGDDKLTDMDELYFNLIGTDWDTNIKNVTFEILMPSQFDKSKLNFTYGKKGSKDNSKVNFNVDGTLIKGNLDYVLKPKEALTVALPLPEGYFTEVEKRTDFGDIIYKYYIFIFSGLLLIAMALWFIFGRNNKIFPTVEFYAPSGMTSADIGYICDGKVDPYDITSLIIYWADKGYLSITENVTKYGLFTDKVLTLTKLRELEPQAKDYEKKMFDDLFSSYGDGVSVSTEDLKKSFYVTMGTVAGMIKNSHKRSSEVRIFRRSSYIISFVMRLVSLVAAFAALYGLYNRSFDISFKERVVTALVAGGILWIALWFFADMIHRWKAFVSKKNYFAILKIIFFNIVILAVAVYFASIHGQLMHVVYGYVISFSIMLLSVYCLKRTSLGDKCMEKILGFREFLLHAEKDRINMLVEQNPNYFYNVLPFAMVLGVTHKWAKSFDTITSEPPKWYISDQSYNAFNTVEFATTISASMNQFNSTMSSKPPSSSSSSGGSSSGGSSGGGSGGGGGSSW